MLMRAGFADTKKKACSFFDEDVRNWTFCPHLPIEEGTEREPRMTLEQREVATKDEIAAALRCLSDADLRRLERIARIRVIGLHAVDWQDLLNEAIVRLLEGSRRWPRDVPLIVFLRETMRSIASEYWRRLKAPVVVSESEANTDRVTGDGIVDNTADWTTQPERRASADEVLELIEREFADDADALQVIDGMVRGNSPRAIHEEACINATRYASTQRRIRRRLARMFPDGGDLV